MVAKVCERYLMLNAIHVSGNELGSNGTTQSVNEEAARREAIEESGCTLRDIKFLCSFNSANGMSDHLLHLYGAQVDSEAAIQDVDEVAYKVWMPVSEVKELLRNNETKDAVSMMAILFALQFYKY